MKSIRISSAVLALAVAATTALPAPAQAQGFFERLFGAPKRRVIAVDEFPQAPKVKKQKQATGKSFAKPALIQSPSYYTYRADPMVQVDFSKIVNAPQKVVMARNDFLDGIPGLTDYVLRAEKPVSAALGNYYSSAQALIWVTDGAINDRARQAMRVMAEADSYGLSPSDYAVDVPTGASDPATLMRFEMAMSARVLRYVRDAQGGRIDPNRITGYYDFPAKTIDLSAELDGLSRTQEVATLMESHHPRNPQYQALKNELAALRREAANEIIVDNELVLKPGEQSAELPKLVHLIASRLDDESGGEFGELLYKSGNSEVYSEELVPVFKAEQKKAGLKPDGVIGPRTVKAIAGVSKADRMDKVLVALEQLRWLPSDFGSPRVWINQPAFTAQYIEGESEKLSMRVVIGKPTNQTSFFYDEIEQVDYNPYWGVPQSIIVNEMLPRLRRDPGYLDRSGYEVFNAKGQKVSSSSVGWGAYGNKIPFNIRQEPSEANALGELKILFPNKHAIYMHDTPSKSFFQRDMRALSHGCVRLQDPRGMAAAVLGKDVDYIKAKLAKGHSMEKVDHKIPVYVSYFTAWPREDGQVDYFADVYDRDSRLQAAVKATDEVRAASM